MILADLGVGSPTNFGADWFKNSQGAQIATVSGAASNLLPGITPVPWTEAVNILNTTQFAKFNVVLDTGGAVTKLTLGEKWEGLALVPALDPQAPDDYFLFVGYAYDFLVSSGRTIGPDPSLGIITYNGFASHPAAHIPPPVGSPNNENDTMFLVYRVTIASVPPVLEPGVRH